MSRKLSINEIKERLKKVHGDVVTLDESTYVNICTKARFVDRDFGEWFASPSKILYGQGHPKRGFKKSGDSRRISVDILYIP